MATRRLTTVLLLFAVGCGLLLLLLAGGGALATGGGDTAQVSANNTANVSLYYAETAEFPNVTALEAGIEGGTATGDTGMLFGETLVIAIESERLANDLEAGEGSTTGRFFDVLAADADIGLIQHPDTYGTHISPWRLALDPTHTTVYRNGSTTYVATPLDPGRDNGDEATYEVRSERTTDPPALAVGVAFSYEVAFGPGEDEVLLLPPDEHPTVWVFDQPVQLEDDPREYTTWSVVGPEVVTGLARGGISRRITARAEFANGSSVSTAFVPPAGAASLTEFTLDFRDVEPGSNYTLELQYDDTVVERRNGTVREISGSVSNPRIRAVDADSDVDENDGDDLQHGAAARDRHNDTVQDVVTGQPPSVAQRSQDDDRGYELIVNASLSHGGWVGVVDERGEEYGWRFVEPGHPANISIPLSDTLRDDQPAELRVLAVRFGGAEDPVLYDDPNATVRLNVSDRDWSHFAPTPTPDWDTPTPTPGSTPTQTEPTPTEATPTPSTQPDPTATVPGTETVADDDGTGFGPLLALGSLAGLGWLLGRRRAD